MPPSARCRLFQANGPGKPINCDTNGLVHEKHNAFPIEGCRIVRNHGACGTAVRSRGILRNFAGGLQALCGGHTAIFSG